MSYVYIFDCKEYIPVSGMKCIILYFREMLFDLFVCYFDELNFICLRTFIDIVSMRIKKHFYGFHQALPKFCHETDIVVIYIPQ